MNQETAISLTNVDKELAPTRRYHRYSAYRDSGIEWLGEVPEHWKTWKLTHAFGRLGSGTTPRSESEEYYGGNVAWVTTSELRESIITDTAKKLTKKALSVYPTLRVYPSGTLLFAMYGATIGRLGILGIPATVNQACCAFSDPIRIDTLFAYYWLQMRRPVLIALSTGGGQPNLSQDDLRTVRIPAPPLDEQAVIVAFLDRETARIDELIAKKQQLIELLAEKRTALISYAVSKGLNSDIQMKDSGIRWVGQVPSHWTILPLKFIAMLQTGLTLGKKYGDEQSLVSRPYLRVANVQDGYLELKHITQVELPPSDVSRYELRVGDMLMTEGGDFDKLGRGYVWDGQVESCLHQNHIFAVRPDARRLNSRFLACLTSSWHGKAYFTSTSSQTTNLASTNSTKLKSFPVLLPPVVEQESILAHITQTTERHDRLMEATQTGIDRLGEYRSALISAAVTGKIDVRGEESP